MDRDPSGRKRGKDKAKRTFEKFGKYTARSQRIEEASKAKHSSSGPSGGGGGEKASKK